MNQVSEFEVTREKLLRGLEEYIAVVQTTDVKKVANHTFLKQLEDMSVKMFAANLAFMKTAGKIAGKSKQQLSSYIPYELCFIPS